MTITFGPSDADLRVISYGGGVQSTALVLKAMRGDFGDPPDLIVFADTQWEPESVYQTVDAIEAIVRRSNRTAFRRVTAGNLREDIMRGAADGTRFSTMPFHLKGAGMARRQCTRDYKITPVVQTIREHVGLRPRQQMKIMVETWIGFTTDELARCAPSRLPWETKRFPLIESGMSRGDCRAFMAREYPEIPVGKSACLGCPYSSNEHWRTTKADADAWADVLEFDDALRDAKSGYKHGQYLHRSCVPLRDANLGEDQGDMFQCNEGSCGT